MPRQGAEPATDAGASVREDSHTFGALGSGTRRRILDAIATGPRSVQELAEGLGVHVASVRYHLGILAREKLVEEVPSRGNGGRGRPSVRYRAAGHPVVPGFPPRHFEIIAAASLQALAEGLGEANAAARLRTKGAEMGRALVEARGGAEGVRRWSPEAFERHVLGGLLPEYGVRSEVLSRDRSGLRFRAFTCPFLELAQRMPKYVCDALDVGFHEGIDAALGGVVTERVACMGHGSPYCEYRMAWRAERAGSRGGGGVP